MWLLNPYRFAAGAPTDPNFANVSLLLHGNADGSGNIVDSSLSPKTVSKFGNAASATPPAYPNSNSAFGSAIAFDGTNDYLTANNSDLVLGTNDFTIEFWVRRSVSTSRAEVVIDYRTAEPQSNIHIYLNPDGGGIYTARVYVNGADRITGTTTLAVDTWYHLAVSRASGQVRLFVNGVQNGSAHLDSSNYSSSSLAIGGRFAQFGGSYLSPNGFIDDLRITNGIARYTANFTPPTAPFPDVATQQLWTPAAITTALWLDANDSGTITQSGGAITTWADKSGNNRTATADGNPTYSATGLSTGRPAVQLDGTGDAFVSSITGIGSFNALDVYMVTQTTAAAAADANSGIFWGYGNTGAASGSYPVSRCLILTSATSVLSGELVTIAAENTAAIAGRLGSNSYARAANTAQILNSRNATAGTSLLADGSIVTLNLANQITVSSNTAPSAIGYTVDSNLHIGALRASGALVYSPAIKFGEIIVTSTLLSTDNRQRIEGYLAHKWGLTANLPADHPYKTVPPYLTYDVDAAAYIAAVEAADGQTLETSVKDAINTFVIGCKADGIWTAIKASCIMAGARTLAGALVPLVGTAPTRFGTEGGWNYNRKTGLQGNGTNNYLNSNRNNNADPQNSQHLSAWKTTIHNTILAGTFGAIIGAGGTLAGASQIFRAGGVSAGVNEGARSRNTVANTPLGPEPPATGFVGLSRAAAEAYTYRTASAITSITQASETPSSDSIFVFARNNGSGTPQGYLNSRLAFYSIGESLNLALLDARVTRLVQEIEFSLNTGLSGAGYDIDTLRYVNAGYAAGGTLA